MNTQFESVKPFLIRGHHLPYFSRIVMGYEPADLARDQTETIQNLQDTDPDYVRDVCGDTDGQLLMNQRRLQWLYTRFIRLPDPYPVEIVAGQPDEVCNACIIGKHCTELGGSYEGMAVDAHNVFLFVEVAGSCKFGDQARILAREVQFSDAERRETIYTRVNAAIVRSVLEYAPHRFDPI